MISNSFTASTQSILRTLLTESTLINIKSYNLLSYMAERKKYLTFFKNEKNLSSEAFVLDKVKMIAIVFIFLKKQKGV